MASMSALQDGGSQLRGAAGFVPPPAPSLNGGLYTGEPFQRGAGWANVPATPDAGYLNLVNLQSAGPAPYGAFHLPGGGLRPGNNTPLLPSEWAAQRVPDLGLICIPDAQAQQPRPFGGPSVAPPGAQPAQGGFRAHAYLPAHERGAWPACACAPAISMRND